MSYLPLRRLLPSEIDFCPLELPGRAARVEEQPITTMSVLIDHLCEALDPLLKVPFACFGHSAGALMAYEASRHLRSQGGRSAVHVFVSGHAAPGSPVSALPLSSLTDSDLLIALSRFGATPPSVLARSDLMSLVLPTVRADLAIAETYQANGVSPITSPLTAFAGTDDTIEPDTLKAWDRLTSARFRFRLFNGAHFYFFQTAAELAREIVADLDLFAQPAAHRESTP